MSGLGVALRLLDLHYSKLSKHRPLLISRPNSTCTFDASSLEYTTFSFFPGNGMPVKEVRQK